MSAGVSVLLLFVACAGPGELVGPLAAAMPARHLVCEVLPVRQDPTTAARISMIEFAALNRIDGVLVVDVRHEVSFRAGRIPGAVNVPLPDVAGRIDEIRRLAGGRPVVTYCACSEEQTSAMAAATMVRAGLQGVRALSGGFDAWVSRGGRVER